MQQEQECGVVSLTSFGGEDRIATTAVAAAASVLDSSTWATTWQKGSSAGGRRHVEHVGRHILILCDATDGCRCMSYVGVEAPLPPRA